MSLGKAELFGLAERDEDELEERLDYNPAVFEQMQAAKHPVPRVITAARLATTHHSH